MGKRALRQGVLAASLVIKLVFLIVLRKKFVKEDIPMKMLEEKILTEGKVLEGGKILKVDGFLNHQLDVKLLSCLGEDLYDHFKDCEVTKVLTVEASGIGLACMTAQFFNCRVLVAKKSKSANIANDVYSSRVYSFTHGNYNDVIVSKEYLQKGDKVLIVDDFLANGEAGLGLIKICEQAGAEVVGFSAAICKVYQGGLDKIKATGVKTYCLAEISSMDENGIKFLN